MFIPFERTKSLSMKLPVALLSKRALTEWSLLVFIVPISTGRSKEVPRVSKVLIERSLGSLFSHLGLRSGAEIRGVRDGASTSSLSIVLESSIVNIVNLFTGDWGTLIAGRAKQNPLLGLSKPLFPLLYPSGPLNLQSIPLFALRLTSGHPNGGGSPS